MNHKCLDADNEFTLALQDGELVDFRPVRQDDRETIQNGMSSLSVRSRRFRFFTPMSKLSDTLLHYFTEVDQHNHVAWIALAHDTPEHPGLGIARFIRIQDQPTIAEFAVVIIDGYQKRGLGTILMAIIYLKGKTKGINVLRAFVLPENTVMIGWLRRLGAVGIYENGIYRMDLTVGGDLSALPQTETVRLLRHYIERLGQPA